MLMLSHNFQKRTHFVTDKLDISLATSLYRKFKINEYDIKDDITESVCLILSLVMVEVYSIINQTVEIIVLSV